MSQLTNNPECSVTVVKLAEYNGDDHFLLLILKGADGLADFLPYHFPQGKDHYRIRLSGQSAQPMLGITLTSSDDKEASSTGMSSGQR